MNSQRSTGILLIAGALVMLVGIAAHPHHVPSEPSVDVRGQNLVVAVLVLFSLMLTGVGLLRLQRQLPHRLSRDFAAIVLLATAASCSLAAIHGHIVVPRLVHALESDDASIRVISDVVLAREATYVQVLAAIMFSAWAMSLLMLSISALQGQLLGKLTPVFGILFAVVLLFLLATGGVSMTLHDVGIIVLASAGWLIATGISLCRMESQPEEQHPKRLVS